jgi:hypothetical protein
LKALINQVGEFADAGEQAVAVLLLTVAGGFYPNGEMRQISRRL